MWFVLSIFNVYFHCGLVVFLSFLVESYLCKIFPLVQLLPSKVPQPLKALTISNKLVWNNLKMPKKYL